MTPEEWRAGFRRLALSLVVLGVVIVLLALPFAKASGSFRRGLATSSAIAAIPFLLGGAAVHLRGESRVKGEVRKRGDGPGTSEELKNARRHDDRLALGLLATGIVLFALAVGLG